jgi:hypothetical protein
LPWDASEPAMLWLCLWPECLTTQRVQVDVVEKSTPFLHFVTNVCAIVGGLWAVSGLIDSTVYHGQRLIKKKIDIGKYG